MNQMQSIYDLFRGEKGKKESYANIAGGVVSICVVIGVRSLGGKKTEKFRLGVGKTERCHRVLDSVACFTSTLFVSLMTQCSSLPISALPTYQEYASTYLEAQANCQYTFELHTRHRTCGV
jgi:hypothetical protein